MKNNSQIGDGMNARERRHAKRREQREKLQEKLEKNPNNDKIIYDNKIVKEVTTAVDSIQGYSWNFLNDWSA